jgi:hypothetical protein
MTIYTIAIPTKQFRLENIIFTLNGNWISESFQTEVHDKPGWRHLSRSKEPKAYLATNRGQSTVIPNKVFYDEHFANIVLLLTCLIAGVCGNLITILIINTKSFSKMGSRYFLVALAASDIALLLTQPFGYICSGLLQVSLHNSVELS